MARKYIPSVENCDFKKDTSKEFLVIPPCTPDMYPQPPEGDMAWFLWRDDYYWYYRKPMNTGTYVFLTSPTDSSDIGGGFAIHTNGTRLDVPYYGYNPPRPGDVTVTKTQTIYLYDAGPWPGSWPEPMPTPLTLVNHFPSCADGHTYTFTLPHPNVDSLYYLTQTGMYRYEKMGYSLECNFAHTTPVPYTDCFTLLNNGALVP
jgi:hypothetical protein